jgi:hypothetical protein
MTEQRVQQSSRDGVASLPGPRLCVRCMDNRLLDPNALRAIQHPGNWLKCYKVAALNGLNRINYSGKPHLVAS